MKKLYLITRVFPGSVGYDEYDGFVVAAASQKSAFKLMAQHKEGAEWLCEYIGVSNRTTEGIILGSFQAG